RRDVVTERGDVDVAKLRDRERVGSEGEADVRVRQLRSQPRPRRLDELEVVDRRRRLSEDRAGKAEVRRGEAAVAEDARLELLDVPQRVDVGRPGERGV